MELALACARMVKSLIQEFCISSPIWRNQSPWHDQHPLESIWYFLTALWESIEKLSPFAYLQALQALERVLSICDNCTIFSAKILLCDSLRNNTAAGSNCWWSACWSSHGARWGDRLQLLEHSRDKPRPHETCRDDCYSAGSCQARAIQAARMHAVCHIGALSYVRWSHSTGESRQSGVWS